MLHPTGQARWYAGNQSAPKCIRLDADWWSILTHSCTSLQMGMHKQILNQWLRNKMIQQDRMNSDYECLVGTWKCFWVLTQDQYTFLKKKYVNKKNNEWGRAVRGRFDRRISTSLSSSSTNNSFWKRQNIYFLELERGAGAIGLYILSILCFISLKW